MASTRQRSTASTMPETWSASTPMPVPTSTACWARAPRNRTGGRGAGGELAPGAVCRGRRVRSPGRPCASPWLATGSECFADLEIQVVLGDGLADPLGLDLAPAG